MAARKSTSKLLAVSLCAVSLVAAMVVFKTQNPNLSRLSLKPNSGFMPETNPITRIGSKLQEHRNTINLPDNDSDWQSEHWSKPNAKYTAIQNDINKALADVNNGNYLIQATIAKGKKTISHYKAILDKSTNDPLAVFGWGYANWKCLNDPILRQSSSVTMADINKKLISVPSPEIEQFARLRLLTTPLDKDQRKIAARLSSRNTEDIDLLARYGRVLLLSSNPADKNQGENINPMARANGYEFRSYEVILFQKELLLSQFNTNPSIRSSLNLSHYLENCWPLAHDSATKKENEILIANAKEYVASSAQAMAKAAQETSILHNAQYIYDMSEIYPDSYNNYYTWLDSSRIFCGQAIISTASHKTSIAGAYFNHILSASHDGKWILSLDSNDPKSNKITSTTLHVTSSKNWRKTNIDLCYYARTSPIWCPDNRHFAFITDTYNNILYNKPVQQHRSTTKEYMPEASNTEKIVNTNIKHLVVYDAVNKRMETIDLPLLISNKQLGKLRNDANKFGRHTIWAASEGDLLSITPQNKYIIGTPNVDLNTKWNYEHEIALLKNPELLRKQIALQKDQKLAQRQLEMLNDPKLIQRRMEAYKAAMNTDYNLYEVTIKSGKPSVRSWSVDIPQVPDANRISVTISPDGSHILWCVSGMPSRFLEQRDQGIKVTHQPKDIMPQDRPHTEIIITDIYGKNKYDIGSTEMFSSFQWNPDSRHISFIQNGMLWQKPIN